MTRPSLDARLRAWRRHLHRHPETAFGEHATAHYVAGVLEELGYDVARGIGGTGVVASLRQGSSDRSVGLRADLDGLLIQEVTGRDHGPVNDGAMHACGFDGTIVVHGRGGHAARAGGCRTIDPVRPAVLSCTGFETDGARNAIPSTVRITGDTRSFDPDVQDLLERRIREIAAGVAAAHGARAEVTYTHEFAPTVNDPQVTARAAAAGVAALGEERVVGDCAPIMPSEDFGVLAGHVPACFALLGNGTEPGRGGTPLHSAS